MRRAIAWVLAVLAALAAAVLLAGPVHRALVPLGWEKEFGSTFRYVALALVLVVVIVGLKPWRDAREDVWGLVGRNARPWHPFAGATLAVLMLLALALGQAAAGWLVFDEGRGSQKVEDRWAAALGRGAVIGFVEELFFRGIVLGRLRRRLAPFAAALAASAVYAVPHAFKGTVVPKGLEPGPAGALEVLRSWGEYLTDVSVFGPKFVGLACLGMLLTAAFYRTRSLWLGIGIHGGAVFFLEVLSAATERTVERNWAGTKWLYDGVPAWPVMLAIAWILWPRASAPPARSAPVGVGPPGPT